MTPQAMIDLFQKHVNAEFAGDLDTTMATMSDDPYLNNVPTMAGGFGRERAGILSRSSRWQVFPARCEDGKRLADGR